MQYKVNNFWVRRVEAAEVERRGSIIIRLEDGLGVEIEYLLGDVIRGIAPECGAERVEVRVVGLPADLGAKGRSEDPPHLAPIAVLDELEESIDVTRDLLLLAAEGGCRFFLQVLELKHGWLMD